MTFLLSKSELKARPGSSYVAQLLMWFYIIIRDVTRTRPSFWELPFDQLVELGSVQEL